MKKILADEISTCLVCMSRRHVKKQIFEFSKISDRSYRYNLKPASEISNSLEGVRLVDGQTFAKPKSRKKQNHARFEEYSLSIIDSD